MTDPLFPPLPLETVRAALAELELPRDFLLGTSTAGYQVEGGFNGEGEPANNWYSMEKSGRVPRTGVCCDFWRRWPEDLDRCTAMGLSAFRMGLEWARLEPRPERPGGQPQLDPVALDTYARMLAGCWERGLRPCVTLHHFTHPQHAGDDLWLHSGRAIDLLVPAVLAAVEAINERLVGEHGQPPIDYFTTINEPFMLAGATHLLGMFPAPKHSFGFGFVRQMLQSLHLAHVALYRGLHALYLRRGWARPTVTLNPYATMLFESDLMLLHILMAPARGIGRDQLLDHLRQEKAIFEDKTRAAVAGLRSQGLLRRGVEGLTRVFARQHIGPRDFSRLIDAVYSGPPGERLLDAISFDFYDPYFGDYVDLALPTVLRLRQRPWTWRQVPAALPTFLELYGRVGGQELPVDLLEQGMCYRGPVGGGAAPRPEGYRRAALLRAGVFACLQARAQGVPVRSSYHWPLLDNYEWGSFEPRFGIHGVLFEEGQRRLDTDILGDDVAGVYRAIAVALAAGDREALAQALADPSS